jgi:transposase
MLRVAISASGTTTPLGLAATVQDAAGFAGPHEFAAFFGRTPKQNSSGGKQRLGRISKMGNRNIDDLSREPLLPPGDSVITAFGYKNH